MKTAIFFSAALLLACGAQNGDDAPAWGTLVWSGSDSYDALAAHDGFVYLEIPGSGVERCTTIGCTQPSSVLGTDAFVTAAFGATTITYATEIMDESGGVAGEIRAVGVDGTGDRSLLPGATHPAWVASSGARTFWADDSFALDETPATIQCVGCTSDGQSTPWISGLGGGTYGMIADDANVYVLADDASRTSVDLVACGTAAPCFGEPRVVLAGLDPMILPQELASDGASVYVARSKERDVVRVSNGAVTVLATSVDATALAFDATSDSLYYGTSSGTLARVKPDGSGATTIGTSTSAIAAIAIDETSAYILTGTSSSYVMKGPK